MDPVTVGEYVYYWDGRYYARHKGLAVPRRLHIDVWEAHNGPVPVGHHVHHIDGDRFNNDISNLIAIDGIEHVREHGSSETAKEHMREVQKLGKEAAKEWHKSSEGLDWHKAQFQRQMKNIGLLLCVECGTDFKPTNFRQKFCCKKCNNRSKMRAWRARQKEQPLTTRDS